MKIMEKVGKKRLLLFCLLAVVVIVAAVYIGMSVYFAGHFQFRTQINGIDCSGKSVLEVERLIVDEIDDYELSLTGRVDGEDVIKGQDINLKPVFDGSLEQVLTQRSSFAWPVSLFRETKAELETMVEYDEKLLEQATEKLSFLQKEVMESPKNAEISSYIEGKGYEIIPEKEGTRIDKKALQEALHTSLINLREEMSLEEENCYTQPKIRKDNEELVKTLKELNQYVSTEVTYDLGEQKEVLNGNQIQEWITLGDDGKVAVDEEKIGAYVKSLAETYDTAKKPRSFTTSYGSRVTLSWNEYGWKIDKEQEAAAILENIKAGEAVKREPVYSQRAKSHGENDHGGTYVEINITAQHLYFYKNGGLVVESDFVSGNLARGDGTPSGAFGLAYKQRDAVLRGEDYRIPVDFWMPFNGGIGLHDATWRSDFGGNYYKSGGSHGCINLPYSVAETIFQNIEAGDAIFVYELPGTESAKGLAQDAAAAVVSAIEAIGEVTGDSGWAIQNARSAYDALNDQAKGYVKNYDTLVGAESYYADILAWQQAEAQAQAEAQPVIDAIAGIGEVALDKEGAIKDARSRYDALSESAKQHVSNANVLVAAEQQLDKLKKEQNEERPKEEKKE